MVEEIVTTFFMFLIFGCFLGEGDWLIEFDRIFDRVGNWGWGWGLGWRVFWDSEGDERDDEDGDGEDDDDDVGPNSLRRDDER